MSPGWTDGGLVRVGAHNLHHVQMGRGPPLILLHKLGGWTREWTGLAQRLAQDRRLVAIDLPGHGRSEAAEPPPRVQTLEDSAAALVAVLDALDLPRIELAGASLGGALAVVIAAAQPERVSRLTLINAPLTAARDAADVDAQDARTAADLWGEGDRPLPRSFEDAARQFGLTDRAIHDDMTASRARAGAWVRPSWRGVALGEVAGRLPRITAPTLILHGARGGPGPGAAHAAALISRADRAGITDAGAFAHQENADAVARAMLGHAGA